MHWHDYCNKKYNASFIDHCMINFFVIINIKVNPKKCISTMKSPFNSLSMQFLKLHFHYLFIFKTSITFCFQIGIIFKEFFHRNIIEKKFRCFIFNCYVFKIFIWLLHFSTFFHECYSTRVEKLKEEIGLPWCVLYFLLAYQFNYLKPTYDSKHLSTFTTSK